MGACRVGIVSALVASLVLVGCATNAGVFSRHDECDKVAGGNYRVEIVLSGGVLVPATPKHEACRVKPDKKVTWVYRHATDKFVVKFAQSPTDDPTALRFPSTTQGQHETVTIPIKHAIGPAQSRSYDLILGDNGSDPTIIIDPSLQ